MDMIKLAMNIDEMAEYQALPAGPYRAEIREIEVKVSEKVPNGYIVMKLRIDPSDFPADYDPDNAPEGVSVTYSQVKLPDPHNRRTVAPFKKLLKAVGLEASGSEFVPGDWIGKEVQAFLTTQEFQGSPTNQVESINALPSV